MLTCTSEMEKKRVSISSNLKVRETKNYYVFLLQSRFLLVTPISINTTRSTETKHSWIIDTYQIICSSLKFKLGSNWISCQTSFRTHKNAFNKVDLPTLGCPTMANCNGSLLLSTSRSLLSSTSLWLFLRAPSSIMIKLHDRKNHQQIISLASHSVYSHFALHTHTSCHTHAFKFQV